MRLEPAHLAHILFAAEGVNHAARSQEQTSLKKRMGENMKDRRAESAQADGDNM
jgi:hypothetical protein